MLIHKLAASLALGRVHVNMRDNWFRPLVDGETGANSVFTKVNLQYNRREVSKDAPRGCLMRASHILEILWIKLL